MANITHQAPRQFRDRTPLSPIAEDDETDTPSSSNATTLIDDPHRISPNSSNSNGFSPYADATNSTRPPSNSPCIEIPFAHLRASIFERSTQSQASPLLEVENASALSNSQPRRLSIFEDLDLDEPEAAASAIARHENESQFISSRLQVPLNELSPLRANEAATERVKAASLLLSINAFLSHASLQKRKVFVRAVSSLFATYEELGDFPVQKKKTPSDALVTSMSSEQPKSSRRTHEPVITPAEDDPEITTPSRPSAKSPFAARQLPDDRALSNQPQKSTTPLASSLSRSKSTSTGKSTPAKGPSFAVYQDSPTSSVIAQRAASGHANASLHPRQRIASSSSDKENVPLDGKHTTFEKSAIKSTSLATRNEHTAPALEHNPLQDKHVTFTIPPTSHPSISQASRRNSTLQSQALEDEQTLSTQTTHLYILASQIHASTKTHHAALNIPFTIPPLTPQPHEHFVDVHKRFEEWMALVHAAYDHIDACADGEEEGSEPVWREMPVGDSVADLLEKMRGLDGVGRSEEEEGGVEVVGDVGMEEKD